MKEMYQSRLPHLVPLGAAFFITFRLADSLPRNVIAHLRFEFEEKVAQIKEDKHEEKNKRIYEERKRAFGRYDHQLDRNPYGECQLKDPSVAQFVKDKLHEYDGELYHLFAYCIMPNHIHLLLDLSAQLDPSNIFNEEYLENYVQLNKIMQRIKGGTARSINAYLNRKGTFWQKDSYDHCIRNEMEWDRILNYIVNNPVNAGLVGDWKDWPHTYLKVDPRDVDFTGQAHLSMI